MQFLTFARAGMATLLISWALLLVGAQVQTQAQTQAAQLVLDLQNNTGIVEDTVGAVVRWENQASTLGDAVQPDASLAGEQRQETYPGKVNVGFSTTGSFMTLESSGAYFSDGSFSVFYAGHVGDVTNIATLFGNFSWEASNSWSGIRFVRRSNGDLAMQYGSPNWSQLILSSLPENEFFYFGFTMDAAGNYRYFDNASESVITGQINATLQHLGRTIRVNRAQMGYGSVHDQTEIAELKIYDDVMDATTFEDARLQLAASYPELVKSSFEVTGTSPSWRVGVSRTAALTISFSDTIGTVGQYPTISVNKGATTVSGQWSQPTTNSLQFTPDAAWPEGALVKVSVEPQLTSTTGALINLAGRTDYNFVMNTSASYGLEREAIASIGTVNSGTHNLPMKLTLPQTRTTPVPVYIWVHGGGWSGGTAAESNAPWGPHANYLAREYGIATVGVAYRCLGSNGTFTQAMEDIGIAYQWVVDNADVYNFDLSRVVFAGGSAGTPLASLAAQRYDGVAAFIGLNGLYDFTNNSLSSFGNGNNYGQQDPSALANSALHNLNEGPPAVLLLHGDADTVIHMSQSTNFGDAVAQAGSGAEVVIYADEPHAFFNWGWEQAEDVLWEMIEFLSINGLTQ